MYDEYEDVFGYRENAFEKVVLDTALAQNDDSIQAIDFQESFGEPPNETGLIISNGPSQVIAPVILEEYVVQDETSVPASVCSNNNTKRGQKGIYSRTGLSDVLQVQNEILSMRKSDKEKEVKLKNAELELEKEKLLFEKQKHADEMQQRTAQLEMERILKIRELKMKKQIALKEIEMKREIEMEKLKKS